MSPQGSEMSLRIRIEQISKLGVTLTLRERQILKRMCLGQSFQQIATAHGLSRISIWRIKLQIYGKLDVAVAEEFRELCYRQGWMTRPKRKPEAEPVVYRTVEGAAGPQGRFRVGTTTGDNFFRFRLKPTRRKNPIEAVADGMLIDMETTLGFLRGFETDLRDFRRVYPTYAAASDASLPYRLIPARVIKWKKHGYLIVSKPHTPAAATFRLDQLFVMERQVERPGPEAFHFLLHPKDER